MKNKNILSAYCFLAALTENNNDLYNHVYVPMCKRALSKYSRDGKEFGTHLDIKETILEMYGIDVPESIVCKLIRGSEASMSRRKKEEISFKVLENGRTFQLDKWVFKDFEETFDKSQREANAIESLFQEYVSNKRNYSEKIPPFSDYLSRYKTQLSSFFEGEFKTIERTEDETFYYHVEFLEELQRANHTFFKIAQNLYLGAIVTGFLESGFDLDQRKPSNECFFLDTPIILRGLDLQRAEETNPILELIQLIKKTGSSPKVLSITVEEIQKVINNAIETYNNKNSVTTINDACLRRKKDKAWLMTFNSNLQKNIGDILQLEIENVSVDFIKENEKSKDIPALQELRRCKNNAAHDVFAYLYVRKLRQTAVTVLQNAKVWFVTTNPSLLFFNSEVRLADSVPEIVLPDMLTSLLWLKDPSKLIDEVKKIGLKELMACTIIQEVASKELIHEYNQQIKKIEGIDSDSYNVLLEAVAHYSANSIEKFIELAEQDQIKAREKALQIVEDERTRKAEIQQKIADALTAEEREKAEKEKFAKKLEEFENQLKVSNEKAKNEIDKLNEKLTSHEDIIYRQEKTIDEFGNKINEQDEKITSLKKQIKKDSKKLFIGFIGVVLFVFTFIFKDYLGNWSWVTGIITGSGWIWGFGSFCINMFKLLKKD